MPSAASKNHGLRARWRPALWSALRVCFLFLSIFFLAPTARAAENGVTSALSWVRLPGAETCITAPELGARIEKHLGRAVLVSPSVADVSIEGRIQRAGSIYKATVGGTRHDGTPIGTRELTSSAGDCRSIDDGLVLVVALMIDPNATSAAEPAKPATTTTTTTTHEIVHERVIVRDIEHVPPLPPPPPASTPWLVEAQLASSASIERAPGVAPAFAASARVGPSRLLAFELLFGVLPSAELTGVRSSATTSDASVDFAIIEGGFSYCPTIALGRFDLGGCAGLRAGLLRSSGRGFANGSQDADRGLADIAIGPRVEVRVAGPFFVLVNGAAFVPLVRQETTATSGGATTVLSKRSALGGEVGIGVGLRFSP